MLLRVMQTIKEHLKNVDKKGFPAAKVCCDISRV